MENIYTLTGRYAEINDQYEQLAAELDSMYEESEGEITDKHLDVEGMLDAMAQMKQEIVEEIMQNADKYAEIALNKAGQRKQLEAELKALKEAQKQAVDRVQARINKLQRSEDFWKGCFDGAMKLSGCQKIGGAKTNLMHSIYYKTSESIEVDEPAILAPFQEYLDDFRAALPAWVKVDVSASKAELKKEENLPEGATRVQSETIIIR